VNASPEIVLGAAFALLVFTAVVFVIFLTRSIRTERVKGSQKRVEPAPGLNDVTKPVDASLDGLDAELPQELPDAALLTPLGLAPWAPPETPTNPADLAGASLVGRIADYIPRVQPAIDDGQHEAWVVDAQGLEELEHGQRRGTVVAPWADLIPEVYVPAGSETASPEGDSGVPAPASAESEVIDPDLEATLAALAAAEQATEASRLAAVRDAWVDPVPEPEPELEPEPEPEREPELEPEPEPEREPELEPEPERWPLAIPELEPDPSIPRAPVLDMTAPKTWSPPAPVSSTSRPEARVAPPPRPPDSVQTGPPTLADVSSRSRPVVRVKPLDLEGGHVGGDRGWSRPDVLGPTSPVPGTLTREDVPDVVLAAPVEMWFGDSRVGVRAGSATYERFKKYADAMLLDLNAARETRR